MKEYLQAMHDAKSQMIQNISHNLKTPLSVIMLSCEMLLDGDVEAAQEMCIRDRCMPRIFPTAGILRKISMVHLRVSAKWKMISLSSII